MNFQELDVKIQKQPLEMFCKKVFLKLSQNSQEAEACNFIKKETLAQVFSCDFCEISKNTFFTDHLRRLLLKMIKNLWKFSQLIDKLLKLISLSCHCIFFIRFILFIFSNRGHTMKIRMKINYISVLWYPVMSPILIDLNPCNIFRNFLFKYFASVKR